MIFDGQIYMYPYTAFGDIRHNNSQSVRTDRSRAERTRERRGAGSISLRRNVLLGRTYAHCGKIGICMNITANMLGLGNAATPLGIEAMKALAEEENCGDTAGDNMIIFAVLNTASITLIPTTAASLRLKYGAAEPLDILPAVIFTSAVSLAVSLTAAKLGCLIGRKNKRKEAHHG